MMREAEFLSQLHYLLDTEVVGLTHAQAIDLIRTLCDEAQRNAAGKLPVCRLVPFITGRRPIDEASYPGLGSSDNTSLIRGPAEHGDDKTYLLYHLAGLEQYTPAELKSVALDLTLSFAGTHGTQQTSPIPSWDKRPIVPQVFERSHNGKPSLRAIGLHEASGRNLVVALCPDKEFMPGPDWRWEALDGQLREAATDFPEPFTFGNLFSQMVHASLRLTHQGVPVATSHTLIDVFDVRRFGSLYQRIIEQLIKPDTERQAQAAGLKQVDYAYHPWFPAVMIGKEKATLYTNALVEDIVHKKRHLTDPKWLVRVGLYLEFLTCLGICEAVKQDMGDLLTPAERAAYERSPYFAEIRRRLNPKGWRRVWELRGISFPRFGVPQAGPVSLLNLLQKKEATLAFLRVHHNDLKHAVELAGPNAHNAQETWHRVFRDAERAVLRRTQDAFPELAFMDRKVKKFVLWHQKGNIGPMGNLRMPQRLSRLFGDQDGLFASACRQYRTSMNEVAKWAKDRGLMDYTGAECVPEQVSLLEAYLRGQAAQIERLQHRDGYAGSLESIAKLPKEYQVSAERIYELLEEVPLFNVLTEDERRHLANTCREISLGPMERIIIQGRHGTSLFVVGEGRLEVLVRQLDGVDRLVNVIKRGDVVGEVSLLTGAPRTATVRATDGAVVYEIGLKQYETIVKARPALVDELATIMEEHLRTIHEASEAYNVEQETALIRQRIKRFFFGV